MKRAVFLVARFPSSQRAMFSVAPEPTAWMFAPVLVAEVRWLRTESVVAEDTALMESPPVIESPALRTLLVAVVAVVAVAALPEIFPVSDAVIVPAVKLPEASLATMALAVFALVAVVAELATLEAVVIWDSFESAILPASMPLVTFNAPIVKASEPVTSPVCVALVTLAVLSAIADSSVTKREVTVERLTADCGTDTTVAAAAPGPLAVILPVNDVM